MKILKQGNPPPEWWEGRYDCQNCHTEFDLDHKDRHAVYAVNVAKGPYDAQRPEHAVHCPVCDHAIILYQRKVETNVNVAELGVGGDDRAGNAAGAVPAGSAPTASDQLMQEILYEKSPGHDKNIDIYLALLAREPMLASFWKQLHMNDEQKNALESFIEETRVHASSRN